MRYLSTRHWICMFHIFTAYALCNSNLFTALCKKNKYTLIYNKHKLPLGRAVHNCKQHCSTYWNWTYNIHSTVNHSCTSRRSSLSGHIVSSTSQRISSLAMQRGKYLLEWRIHPLQDSAVMSSHAASMATSRAIWVCGWRSYTFHLQEEKKSSIGFRNGE